MSDIKEWKLLLGIYNYDGFVGTHEGEPELYQEYIDQNDGMAGWLIGYIFEHNGNKATVKVLEGDKAALELVMKWRDKYLQQPDKPAETRVK